MLGARASVIKFIIGLFGLVSLVGIAAAQPPDPGVLPPTPPCADELFSTCQCPGPVSLPRGVWNPTLASNAHCVTYCRLSELHALD